MRRLIALLLLALPAALDARGPREMMEIEAGQPVSIRPDRAYILFRTVRPEGVPSVEPVFLRIPTAAEMERYLEARRLAFQQAEPGLIRDREAQLRKKGEAEAAGKPFKRAIPPPPSVDTFNFVYDEVSNVQRINYDRAFVKGRPESVFLVELPPGDYVLYGASYGSWALKASLFACWCLGTVGFPAPAGVVTDLGYFMGDMVHEPSKIPELAAESDLGPSSVAIHAPLGATVRPARPDSPVPEPLRAATVRPADYRAIGRFVDPRAITINRLAPVPGVLAYEGRRVIDVKSGTDAASPQ
jgi:hypothetical protein